MSGREDWYCFACGAPALRVATSLSAIADPGRCLGIHRRGALVPITVSLQAVADAMAHGEPTRARRLHAKHLQSKLQPDHCRLCAAMWDADIERRQHATA